MGLDTLNSSIKLQGRVLAIDYGLKKMGFAVGDTLTFAATPEGVVQFSSFQQSVELIVRKFEQWRPISVVLGLPLDKDGNSQFMTKKVKELSHVLETHVNCPIFFSDERYTTKVAQKMLKDSHCKVKFADDWAAALILQCWLNQQAQESLN